jgi:hypothetical protein
MCCCTVSKRVSEFLLIPTLSHYTLWIVNVKSHCYFLFFRYFAGMLRYKEIIYNVMSIFLEHSSHYLSRSFCLLVHQIQQSSTLFRHSFIADPGSINLPHKNMIESIQCPQHNRLLDLQDDKRLNCSMRSQTQGHLQTVLDSRQIFPKWPNQMLHSCHSNPMN